MRLILAFTAAAAFLVAPLGATALTSGKTLTYHTSYRQTQPMPQGGVVTGRMTLTFAKGGTVNGTYRNEFQGGFHSVAGGVSGASIWLSLGSQGRGQFKGTIHKNGEINGTLTNWQGPNVYEFTAIPQP